jgi:SagB-type dehydrogenase family enzyme
MAAAVDRAPAVAGTRLLAALRPDVELEREGEDALVLTHPWGRLRLAGLVPAELAALESLAAAAPVELDGLPRTPRFERLLDRLEPLLQRTVALGGRLLATSSATSFEARLRPAGLTLDSAIGLSPAAFLRRTPACTVESPLALHRIELHDRHAAALVAALDGEVSLGELADVHPWLTPGAVLAIAGLLAAAGLAGADETAPALWDFHDLLFHARSRLGRNDEPFGGVYKHRDVLPPLPAVAPQPELPLLELPRPDWTEVVSRDLTLTEALEERRSVREYADDPIGVAQLGELLYRAARVRGVVDADPAGGLPYDALDRPFPTGGGSGELELYLTVARCDGLEPGAYRYDAAAHGLRLLPTPERDRHALLAAAWRAAAGRVEPQVLVTVTSRFGRLSWKYSGIAYALTLKHVGVLYQTLYLVATAMGLAPCALGSGDADAAARAFGLEWASESSVGEFLLGSRPRFTGEAPGAFADVVAAARRTTQ